MRIRILFATLASLLLVCPLHAQPVDKAKLDRFLDHLSEKNQGMGALTIVRDGEVVYEHAFGFGQMEDGVKQPLTPASRFRIGSITKMFTAVLIYQLADEPG